MRIKGWDEKYGLRGMGCSVRDGKYIGTESNRK